ncbi:probable serine/threonine-protein kinase clkA isoform X2 [Cephus cinctus]|uniref:Probable serine/threonine-protein kinase clkA isoform X2 n=1 Tax=Cephus cinctus TaxID=211228 RepID=A0AAJ7BQX9_CEPCN|nr:probable serine/threonine-protein kinase clkA isoform X2 [Cephus cinctus]
MPLSYCVRHTYLETNRRMIRAGTHGSIMTNPTRQYENETDSDCSGRSLATLVIAWVGAAMIASILLRWTYMWIALTVLTLLFLVACGYATCNARRAHLRAMMEEEEWQAGRQRRRERRLETVSGGVDNYPEVINPPAYENYWITDLPPAYTVVVGEHGSEHANLPPLPDEGPAISNRRNSNPPPYSVAIQSEPAALASQSQSGPITDQNGHHSQSTDQSGLVYQSMGRTVLTPGGQSSQHYSNFSRRNVADEDKQEQDAVRANPQPQNSTVLLSGTQYLTNIINSTFGRGQRRVNTENSGQNNALNTESSSNSQNSNGNNNSNNNSNINSVDIQSTIDSRENS